MQTDYGQLKQFYGEACGEDGRLERDQAHAIEFITTMQLFDKYLPRQGKLLDCCAGTGVYAFPLAEKGLRVTAGDFMPEHVALLQEKNENGLLEGIYQGNVLDMSRFVPNSFDVVLCLGALYHLLNEKERRACVVECLRVLKPGGIFAFAYLNRNVMYINHFARNLSNLNYQAQLLETGINLKVFYGMAFGEVGALVGGFPLVKITDAGVDGLMYPFIHRLNEASRGEFEAYMRYHLATCEEPSIIGHSSHGLWIGRKEEAEGGIML